jgi:hypothetical protein
MQGMHDGTDHLTEYYASILDKMALPRTQALIAQTLEIFSGLPPSTASTAETVDLVAAGARAAAQPARAYDNALRSRSGTARCSAGSGAPADGSGAHMHVPASRRCLFAMSDATSHAHGRPLYACPLPPHACPAPPPLLQAPWGSAEQLTPRGTSRTRSCRLPVPACANEAGAPAGGALVPVACMRMHDALLGSSGRGSQGHAHAASQDGLRGRGGEHACAAADGRGSRASVVGTRSDSGSTWFGTCCSQAADGDLSSPQLPSASLQACAIQGGAPWRLGGLSAGSGSGIMGACTSCGHSALGGLTAARSGLQEVLSCEQQTGSSSTAATPQTAPRATAAAVHVPHVQRLCMCILRSGFACASCASFAHAAGQSTGSNSVVMACINIAAACVHSPHALRLPACIRRNYGTCVGGPQALGCTAAELWPCERAATASTDHTRACNCPEIPYCQEPAAASANAFTHALPESVVWAHDTAANESGGSAGVSDQDDMYSTDGHNTQRTGSSQSFKSAMDPCALCAVDAHRQSRGVHVQRGTLSAKVTSTPHSAPPTLPESPASRQWLSQPGDDARLQTRQLAAWQDHERSGCHISEGRAAATSASSAMPPHRRATR